MEDKWKLVPAFLQVRGLVQQHIDSFNYFIDTDLQKIVAAESNCVVVSDFNPDFYLKYTDIRVGQPFLEENAMLQQLTPHDCRIRDMTYDAPIVVDVEYTIGDKIMRRKDVEIGRMPIMLGSSRCVLTGKSHEELALLKECPYDPRGYFIVRGAEKVVLIQEQPSKNRIIVELDGKKLLVAQVTSTTHEKKSRTGVCIKAGALYMRHNIFAEDLPLAVVFKAMGVESDQELFHMIGAKYSEALILCLKDCHAAMVFSQLQALKYLGNKVKSSKAAKTGRTKVQEAKDLLVDVVLSHVPCENYDFSAKSRYLALMARRVLEASVNPAKIDDKDYYGNKRLELAGQLIALLFEDLFKRFNSDVKRYVDLYYQKTHSAKAEPLDAVKAFRKDSITGGLVSAIASGNWSLKRFKMERAGVTEVLSRLTYLGTLGMMTRVSSQFEKTRKIAGPRSLQPSQYGMMCPSDTPDGESCGLVKNLALTSHITTDQDENPLIALCYEFGTEDFARFSGDELSIPGVSSVFLNGQPLGAHRDPDFLIAAIRKLRRSGKISEFVSIYRTEDPVTVQIACDGGRITRPLIIVENGEMKVTARHIRQLVQGIRNFKDFIREGLVEFLDVNEENGALIAIDEGQIVSETTHLEISPFTLLGCIAGAVPFPHHNQSPRITYQCAMGKQAIGSIGLNQFLRVDTILYLLVYPQKPLVTTKTIQMLPVDNFPAGHNASVAIMSYSGFDIEDAVILNRASLDRGFGRIMLLKRYPTDIKRYSNGAMDRIVAPPKLFSDNPPPSLKKYSAIDQDGLARLGEQIKSGDVYVNKQTPLNKTDPVMEDLPDEAYKPAFVNFKGPNPVRIHKVILTSSDEAPLLVKTVMIETRVPELGDKFSSRHGQKGVAGLIVGQEDLPFSETGWCPDLVMNPHGFPSRMTVGKMIELLAGKAGLFEGKFSDGSAFIKSPVVESAELLVKAGFSYTGKDLLTSGTSGELMTAYIFSGPIFYQRLKHLVADKMHARARGPRTVLTRQPTEGRSRDGGLRLGEMERDCLIGYGAANLIRERLMLSSDMFKANVCEKCGVFGWKDWCQYCKSPIWIAEVQLPYACKLLFQELVAMSILPRLKLSQ